MNKRASRGPFLFCLVKGWPYYIQPALNTTAKSKKIISTVQVALFNDASALLALVNIELPLAAIPPIPSPLGLWSSTSRIRRIPEKAQIQVSIELINI